MTREHTDPITIELIRELRVENRRLSAKLVRLELKEISYKNKISALEKEIKSGNNRKLKKLLEEISEERQCFANSQAWFMRIEFHSNQQRFAAALN